MMVPNPPCPICNTPMPGAWMEWPLYPFCSRRCKLIDLGRWLDEGYAVEKKIDEDEPVDE